MDSVGACDGHHPPRAARVAWQLAKRRRRALTMDDLTDYFREQVRRYGDDPRAAGGHARKAVVVNFLSARSDVVEPPDRWFPRPGSVVDLALDVARRVTVRHDYYGEVDCTVVVHLGDEAVPA
jgi:hypothetical protein